MYILDEFREYVGKANKGGSTYSSSAVLKNDRLNNYWFKKIGMSLH